MLFWTNFNINVREVPTELINSIEDIDISRNKDGSIILLLTSIFRIIIKTVFGFCSRLGRGLIKGGIIRVELPLSSLEILEEKRSKNWEAFSN